MMLFKKIFNWIKFKSTPTFFFTKNRLLFERDSKYKKIFNIFGVNFRNSKWGNFELINVKIHFKNFYEKFFLTIFFFLVFFFLIYKKKFIFFKFFANFFTSVVWFCLDSVDYYQTFFLWISIYSSFFFIFEIQNFFSQKVLSFFISKTLVDNRSFFQFYNERNIDKPFLKSFSKNEFKLLFFVWLNDNSQSFPIKNLIIESFFNFNVKSIWSHHYFFFQSLYKLNYLLNLLNFSKSYNIISEKFALKYHFDKFYFNSVYCMLNFNNLFDDNNYLISSSKNYSITNYKFKSNLINFNTKRHLNYFNEIFNYNFFYLNKINFSDLNYFKIKFSEIKNIDHFISNQIDFSKWNRWLYRYSVIHRRTIKNSHKITIIKRFLRTGFFHDDLFKKNPWSSHRYKKLNYNLLNNINYQFFFNRFINKNVKSDFFFENFNSNIFIDCKTSYDNLSFYENSYFWGIKKFFLQNSISNNQINSTPLYHINLDQNYNRNRFQFDYFYHFYYLFFLNRIFLTNTSDFYFSYNRSERNAEFAVENFSSISFFSKDIFLDFDESNFFNFENLNINSFITLNNKQNFTNEILFFSLFHSFFGSDINFFFKNKINSWDFSSKKDFAYYMTFCYKEHPLFDILLTKVFSK